MLKKISIIAAGVMASQALLAQTPTLSQQTMAAKVNQFLQQDSHTNPYLHYAVLGSVGQTTQKPAARVIKINYNDNQNTFSFIAQADSSLANDIAQNSNVSLTYSFFTNKYLSSLVVNGKAAKVVCNEQNQCTYSVAPDYIKFAQYDGNKKVATTVNYRLVDGGWRVHRNAVTFTMSSNKKS